MKSQHIQTSYMQAELPCNMNDSSRGGTVMCDRFLSRQFHEARYTLWLL